MSQAQLAAAVGSKQPAIARLERGRANVSTATLVKLADALGSTVRIEMDPVEAIARRTAWWVTEQERAPASFNVNVHINVLAIGVSAGEPDLVEDVPDAEFVVIDQVETARDNNNLLPSAVS